MVDSAPDLPTTNSAHKRVLFICTGNFYRSRFAEAVFNHHAELHKIPWVAFSRGLAIHLAEGHLSTFTTEALETRQIELRHTNAGRVRLSEDDLLNSNCRIAMDRSEHFAMMRSQFPRWADQIDYWDVSDIPFRTSAEALPEIEMKVLELLEEVSR